MEKYFDCRTHIRVEYYGSDTLKASVLSKLRDGTLCELEKKILQQKFEEARSLGFKRVFVA